MSEQLNEKRLQKIDCDLVIRIADKEFLAHREVLTTRLGFFRKQISTDMFNEKQTVMVLDPGCVIPEVFEHVLQYIYISQIKFTITNIEAIYKTATHLKFDDLLDAADKVRRNVYKSGLEAEISIKEFLQSIIRKVVVEHNLFYLENGQEQFLKADPFLGIDKKPLSYENLKVILSVMQDWKEEMFHLCVEWVDSDQTDRQRRLPELLQLIPLDQLSTEFLNETVRKNPILRNNSECSWLFIEALESSKSRTIEESNKFSALTKSPESKALKSSKFEASAKTDIPKLQTPSESMKTSKLRTFDNSKKFSAPNKHTTKSPPFECLYVIDGIGENGKFLSSVSKLDSRTKQWTTTQMPCPRAGFDCAVIGQKIYICNRPKLLYNRKKNTNELFVYDTDTAQCTQLQSTKYSRSYCAIAALNGFIYVAGVEYQLSVVERYSPENDQWETVAPMTINRDSLELVSMNGFLYAIGGIAGGGVNSVERYSPQTNEWEEVASLNNEPFSVMCGVSSAVLNDRIYVTVGGNCEVYHPEEDKWHRMPAPKERLYGVALAVFNGKLLAIGGHPDYVGALYCHQVSVFMGDPDFSKCSKKVERFDFKANAWVPEADMNVARCEHGVAVVKNF